MSIITNTMDYLDGEVLLQGFFAYSNTDNTRKPLVLIAHPWAGRGSFVEDKARQLAQCGYGAFAVDMYGKGVLGEDNDECAKLMQPFIDNRDMVLARMQSALVAAKTLPWVDGGKVAAVGFCFGGLCVLDLARSGADIAGVVSLHGLLTPPPITKPITAKILALHGRDDPMADGEQVASFQQELTDAGADWQLHIYGNTMHAFTNPAANNVDFGTVYQPDADYRSRQSMENFLAEIFVGQR